MKVLSTSSADLKPQCLPFHSPEFCAADESIGSLIQQRSKAFKSNHATEHKVSRALQVFCTLLLTSNDDMVTMKVWKLLHDLIVHNTPNLPATSRAHLFDLLGKLNAEGRLVGDITCGAVLGACIFRLSPFLAVATRTKSNFGPRGYGATRLCGYICGYTGVRVCVPKKQKMSQP